SAKLSDAAGNSTTSTALAVAIDTTIATLATPDLTTATDTVGAGGTTSDNLTKDNTPDFQIAVGNASVGDTVELLVDGSSFATPVTQTLTQADISAGFITLTPASPTRRSSDLSAKLSDAAGNSTTSTALAVA